jgi:hypothetical protein
MNAALYRELEQRFSCTPARAYQAGRLGAISRQARGLAGSIVAMLPANARRDEALEQLERSYRAVVAEIRRE